MNMSETIETVLEAAKPQGKLKRVAKKRALIVPVHEDPKQELRRLVGLHNAWLEKSTSITNMFADKVYDGVKVPSKVPVDIAAQMEVVRDAFKTEASRLELAMKQELKKFDIYNLFLAKVHGCGVVTASYLIAMVDIHKAVKPSQLRRYCGFAVIDGRLERRAGASKAMGGPGTFNDTLRSVLFNCSASMLKAAGKRSYCEFHRAQKREEKTKFDKTVTDKCLDCLATDCPGGLETNYTKIYRDSRHREESAGRQLGAHSKSWHKMVDVFLEDLYTVWRSIEGLAVWPAYHSAKLGLRHEGRIHGIGCVTLSVEEALNVVGNLEPRHVELEQAAE